MFGMLHLPASGENRAVNGAQDYVQRADNVYAVNLGYQAKSVSTDARVLTLDAPAESFYTLEKKRLIVNSFSKWRIDDVETSYRATGGGWVNDSEPEAEFQETVNKSKAMLKAVALAETFAKTL